MLESKLTIGSKEVKNRIVMPPIATYLCADDGKVTDKLLAYYNERAAGGSIGMIMTEHSYICKQGKAKAGQMSISDAGDVKGLRELTAVLKQSGSLAIAQLNHAGSAAPSDATGQKAVSASPVVLPVTPMMGDGTVPEELTQEQIKGVVNAFADAAEIACMGGYDGVEVHTAHAYLLNQFYSPLTNRRTDEYGGSLDNRLRIHREVLKAVRERIGQDVLMSVRLGGCDYMDGGSTISDSVYAAKVLEECGADMISISGGMCRFARPGHDEPGYFRDMSSEVRKAVSIPVLLTGGIKEVSDAEALLADGAADLIGIGRELLKNPKWADQAMAAINGGASR
ncbi:MAG: NADH:flavin oxidoreductase [Bacillota bacterium]|nr:NADH:flavin oxidoreductase [Bacillota bacterium]